MTDSVLIGIGILLLISLLVRVAPAFVPLPLSDAMAERIESVLPVAVFINLAAYCAVSEISADWIPGVASFISLALLLPLVRHIGLIVVVALATAVFLVSREYASMIVAFGTA